MPRSFNISSLFPVYFQGTALGKPAHVGRPNSLAMVVTSDGRYLGLGQTDEEREIRVWCICRCWIPQTDSQRMRNYSKEKKSLKLWFELLRHLALKQCQKPRVQVQPLRSYGIFG